MEDALKSYIPCFLAQQSNTSSPVPHLLWSSSLIMKAASRTRSQDGEYPADIRDVTDGIRKLRKTYN